MHGNVEADARIAAAGRSRLIPPVLEERHANGDRNDGARVDRDEVEQQEVGHRESGRKGGRGAGRGVVQLHPVVEHVLPPTLVVGHHPRPVDPVKQVGEVGGRQ